MIKLLKICATVTSFLSIKLTFTFKSNRSLDPTYFNLYNIFNAFKYALDIQIIRNLTGVQIENRNLVRQASR